MIFVKKAFTLFFLAAFAISFQSSLGLNSKNLIETGDENLKIKKIFFEIF